jgi:protein O-GlcNAc transferase
MAQFTIQQAFDLALQLHKAGRLHEAENLYRQILAREPAHFGALRLLGVLANQAGHRDIAVDLLRRAIVLDPNSPDAHSDLGNALKSRGQLDDAIAAHRRAIALKPDFPEAHNNLGNALKEKRQFDDAINAYRRAIALRPDYAAAYCNLGSALKDNGRLDDAIAAYREAIVRDPNLAEAHNNLGNALLDKGQLDEAISAYRRAIALMPNYAAAFSNLGNALGDKGQFDEAIAACQQTVTLQPGNAEGYTNLGNALRNAGRLDDAIAVFREAIAFSPHSAEGFANLGNALREMGQLDDAISACRQAIALNSELPEAFNNLGNAMRDKGQFDQAIDAYRKAIALRPDYAEVLSNLGNALKEKGRLDEAIAIYQQAIALRPNYAEAHSNLGSALKDTGQIDEAVAAYRRAIALRPGYVEAFSNLLFALHYHPSYDAPAIAEELRLWNRQIAEPLKRFIQVHTNDRDPERRLRVGYVSADFRVHASAHFLVPLLKHHDPRQVELFCYAQVVRPDAMTLQMQRQFATWRSIVGVSDEQAARQIREDRIDLLVDLKMHTSENRLLIFARKPAPVQATWLGYPGGTGLTTIDYRLSDPCLDPIGMDESVYSERTIRLPDTFWCFDPLDGRDIPVSALPATGKGFITFGCLNNFCKVNDGVLTLWAKILRQVDNSRLLLLAPMGNHRARTLERFRQEGIDPSRIEFVAGRSRRKYLETYHRIDVGLDTFPYNGHTTSLDSFWMGVPVVTLIGSTAVGRAGWSQLSNLGLGELAAQTPDQFVQIAVELANDLPRLEQLRSTLRQRMEQSPLMDAPKFARNMEDAYRKMWRAWCQSAC